MTQSRELIGPHSIWWCHHPKAVGFHMFQAVSIVFTQIEDCIGNTWWNSDASGAEFSALHCWRLFWQNYTASMSHLTCFTKTKSVWCRHASQDKSSVTLVFSSLDIFFIPLMFVLTKDHFNQFSQTSQAHSPPFSSSRLIWSVIHRVRNQQLVVCAKLHHNINVSM